MLEPLGDASRSDRALDRLVSELRVALPGVQLLFAFLLIAPFNQRFVELTHLQRVVFGVNLLSAAVSCLFLIAPSVYHRLHHRRNSADAGDLIVIFSRFAVIGAASLAVAINGSVWLVTSFLFGNVLGAISVSGTSALCIALWFVLPLYRRFTA